MKTKNIGQNENTQNDTSYIDPQCVLEDYLIDLSQPPKLPSKEIPEKLPKETLSPGKENIPPLSTQVNFLMLFCFTNFASIA